MRSLLIACGLGGLGALLQAWNVAGAVWVGGAGFVVLALAFFRWLRDAARDARGRSSEEWVVSSDASSFSSQDGGNGACGGDGAGCDGGGGGGD